MVGITLHLIIILGCPGLSRYVDDTISKLTFSSASDGDSFQHGLELFDGLGRGDVLVEDDGIVFLDGLVASADFGDKLRLHHAATIGNGIVKHEELHWGYVHLIADGHPR